MSTNAFQGTAKALLEGIEEGLFLATEHLVKESRDIVPHRDGDLERSIIAIVAGTEAVVVADEPYARAQHEHTDWAHKEGRTDHYLSKPAEQANADGTIAALIQHGIQHRLKRG